MLIARFLVVLSALALALALISVGSPLPLAAAAVWGVIAAGMRMSPRRIIFGAYKLTPVRYGPNLIK